ncbi:hypothetical protein HK405_000994, partial [Cladochytrium tenue]
MFDYSNCNQGSSWKFHAPVTSSSFDSGTNRCSITFTIDSDMEGPVFMYYRLTNFYQNHRRYVKSFDLNQLKNNLGLSSVSTNCNPLSTPGQASDGSYPWVTSFDSQAQIYPCGLIANSYFNDDISDLYSVNKSGSTYSFSQSGIAWSADSSVYIRSSLADLANVNTLVYPPPQWVKAFP